MTREKGIPKVPHHSPDFRIDQEVIKDLSALNAILVIEAMKHFQKI